ncbi:MAG: cation transporter [Ruminococcaceae bacterium]|nr:cation transporter [Oscillospiraceae bacterium]
MKKSTRNMLIAFVLNLMFSAIEIVGGLLTNSISIVSDAVHDLGDSISIGIALLLERKSEKKADEKYTYGYGRYSVIGALLTSTILLVGSVLVMYRSVMRFVQPVVVDHDGMLLLAIVGTIVNALAAWKTSHGNSLNEKTLSLHMLEDVLGWVAVLAGSVLMKLTGWQWIDPVLCIVIAGYVLIHAVGHMRKALYVLAQKAPNELDMRHIKEELEQLEGVQEVHHIHLWTMDGVARHASLHALISEGTAEEFERIKYLLHHELEHFGIVHSTIELEYVPCENAECKPKPTEHHHHHH